MSCSHAKQCRASLTNRIGTIVAGAPMGTGLPGDSAQRAAQGSIVERLGKKHRKKNSALACDPKAEEWCQHCKNVCCHEAEHQRFTVNSEKLHNFLFYHAFRNQYNRKRPNGEKTNTGKHGFDYQDYKDVTSKHLKLYEDYIEKIRKGQLDPDGDDDETMPEPSNPIGASCMNAHLHAVKNTHEKQVSDIIECRFPTFHVIECRFRRFSLTFNTVFEHSSNIQSRFRTLNIIFSHFPTHFYAILLLNQVEQGCNNLVWENHIQTRTVDALIAMVQQSKARIAKATYQEKLDCDFTPYAAANSLEKIEESFWREGCKTHRSAFATIRHGCVLLNCYSGVLRHETVYNGELSDLLCVNHHDQRADNEQFIQVMQMGVGK